MPPRLTPPLRPLKGIRILSLALNLPGPAALMRLNAMGATCTKLEPPAPANLPEGTSGDPMGQYNAEAYTALHAGIHVFRADLKTEEGQASLHRQLAKTDVLLTSFRPSALTKLQLDWAGLHKRYPTLSQVAIVGAAGARAEEPGHDLTYLADNGLIDSLALPPTLFADMGGALMASEAVLKVMLLRHARDKGVFMEVALADAAAFLALPRTWGLTRPPGARGGNDVGGAVGGAHAGYNIYACKDGRIAVAALEPHFARSLCDVAHINHNSPLTMFAPETRAALVDFFKRHTCAELTALAVEHDLPVHCMVG
jgi:alpha-methylacyl-CoA racemase